MPSRWDSIGGIKDTWLLSEMPFLRNSIGCLGMGESYLKCRSYGTQSGKVQGQLGYLKCRSYGTQSGKVQG